MPFDLSLPAYAAFAIAVIALLCRFGWPQLRFRAPVHHGDTIEAFTEVMAVDPSPFRDDAGIVRFRHWGRRQDGVVVFEGERVTLISRRPGKADS